MKKSKIAIICVALILLVGICAGVSVSVAAASAVVDESWISAPQKTLVKCKGDGCDHTACDYVYSFAVVGDTQNLNIIDAADKENEYMKDLYTWIANKQQAYNIQYVLGLGDITQAYYTDYNDTKYGLGKTAISSEWNNAAEAFAVLDNAKIPYSLVRGNHDVSSYFNAKFGSGTAYYKALSDLAKKVDDKDRPMAGFYDPNKIEDTYRKIVIGDDKYIIFTLDWFPTNIEDCTEGCVDSCTHSCLAWLDDVLSENSDYKAIITVHDFVTRDATFTDDYEDTFPYENLTGSRKDWEEVSKTGGSSSPKEIWGVLRKHSNVELILCGHIDEDDIITTQLRGDNGNTVTAMLIDPQTIDSTVEPVGMVAMFYVAADGKVMNVEYISTVRDLDGEAAYLGEQNQFEITLDYSNESGDGWVRTTHGDILSHIYEAHPFHVLLDDDSDDSTNAHLYGSYNSWNEAHTAIRAFNAAYSNVGFKKPKTFYVVMSQDVTDTHSGDRMYNESRLTLTRVVLDLNDHKLTLAGNSELLRFDTGHTGIFPRYGITNGDIKIAASGAYLVKLTTGAVSSGTLDLTDLNITYEVASNKPLITCLEGSDSVSADVTLNVTNCNIDSSKVTGSVTKLFDLADPKNNNFVNLTIKGGSIKGNTVANTTLFTQHIPNDRIKFVKDSEGNYTTVTMTDAGTLPGVFYSDTEDAYGNIACYEFGAATASDSAYEYPLVTSQTTLTDYGIIPAQYYDTQAYPFVLFKNGEVILATGNWKTLIDTSFKSTANYQSGCTLLLRRDYSTSEASGSPSWFARIDDLTIDLDNHTFTRGTNHMFQIFGTESTAHETSLIIKNGTLKSEAAHAPIVFNNADTNTAIDEINITINNVTFDIEGATGGSRGVLDAYGDGTVLGMDISIVLNDCTIDRGSSNKGVILFSLYDDKDGTNKDGVPLTTNKTDIEVTVNGGTLIADYMTDLTFADYSPIRDGMTASADKLILGKGSDGKYLTVKLPTGTSAPTSTYAITNGNHALALDSDDGTNAYFSLYNLTTPYGDLGTGYISAEAYPFAVFYNGVCKGAYSSYNKAIGAAVGFINTDAEVAVCDTAYVVMRRDFVAVDNGYFSGARGNLVIDLQGYTLSSSSNYLASMALDYGTITDADTSFLSYTSGCTFINGTLKNDRSGLPLIGLDQKNNTTASSVSAKKVYLGFENVTFKTKSSDVVQSFNKTTDLGIDVTVVAENCTFDYTAGGKSMFNFANGTTRANIKLVGCEVIASKLDSVSIATIGSDDKLTVSKGDNGVYLTVKQTTNSIPTLSFKADDGSSIAYELASSEGGTYVYVLGVVEVTEYGNISASYADTQAYPIVLFDGNGGFIGAYDNFNAAFTKVMNDTSGTYVLLLRRDMTKTTKKYMGNFAGNLTIDLGGNTLRVDESGNYLLDLGAGDNTGKTAYFSVLNGTYIKDGGRGLACTNYNTSLKENDTNYFFTFEGVTFISNDSTYNKNVIFTTWENGFEEATANLRVKSTFTDCTFDFASSIDGAVMLDLGHSSKTKDRVIHTVEINGGEIIADTVSDYTDRFVILDADTNGRADAITFSKKDGGNYTAVRLPLGASLDGVTVNGGDLTFVKVSETGSEVLYRLRPTSVANIEFTPKMSITLDRDLVMNVYVPAEILVKFSFNGEKYEDLAAIEDLKTEIDGKEYYLVKAPLAASEAASDVKLVATVSVGDSTASATFTFSVIKYAEKLCADGEQAEIQLVSDILSYVRAAYAYFGIDDDRAIARIDELLGENYDENNAPALAGSETAPSEGLLGATLVLDATPAIRFYISADADADAYSFYADGRRLAAIEGSDADGRYLELNVYAYAMCKTITYTVGDASGSYHINSYYAFAKTQGDNSLITLVERFAKYCESAEAYRLSVTE